MQGVELQEASCLAEDYLCISNNDLVSVGLGKEVFSNRKSLD